MLHNFFFAEHFWIAFLTSCIAVLVTALGIYVIHRFGKWGLDNLTYFNSFAAGALIAVSFLHLILESFAKNANATIFLLIGYLAMYFLNRFIHTYVCDRVNRSEYALGLIPMIGIGFHSLVDGVIYSVTFTVSIITGLLASIGLVLHEFPEEVITHVDFLSLD